MFGFKIKKARGKLKARVLDREKWFDDNFDKLKNKFVKEKFKKDIEKARIKKLKIKKVKNKKVETK